MEPLDGDAHYTEKLLRLPNLAVIGGYWDIALRDFGLLLAALGLARLATAFPGSSLLPPHRATT